MFELYYEKNKNNELFKSSKEVVNIETIQNYIPIYKKFFSLNEENFNSINLNENTSIQSIVEKQGENNYIIRVKNKNTINSFFKFSPLIDPLKYMTGKFNDSINRTLPEFHDPTERNSALTKMYDSNNTAYIDSFFYYLSSQLLHHHNFIHGIDFYGSFLCIKNDFKLNIYDDAEYLYDSTFFNNHKNDLFTVDEAKEELILKYETRTNRKKINVAKTLTTKNLSLKSLHDVNDFMFRVEELGKEKRENGEFSVVYEYLNQCKSCKKKETISSTSETSSQCSSTTNHSIDTEEYIEVNGEEEHEEEQEEEHEEDGWDTGEENSSIDGSFEDNEVLEATISQFPVQMICLEKLENTLDSYIEDTEEEPIENDEWASILFQIIMILHVYQKCFDFTHNDLHTNNIMYNETKEKYLYYKYKNKIYKVPTFGKIYKIIDFGRSIYTFKNQFCISDSYHPKGDAATQYNIHPYFNENKPRLEPNKSFDLCRLGCSLFDYFYNSVEEADESKDPIGSMINEWCKDYKNKNILYKRNGEERYEDFKLYKMIARTVKEKEPHNFIERDVFAKYITQKRPLFKKINIMNVDNLPDLTK
jgi:hypothetical protein